MNYAHGGWGFEGQEVGQDSDLHLAHTSTSLPSASIFRVNAQIRHPSPILSRKSRAVVTLGPTVREAVEEVGSSDGVEGRGVRSADMAGLLELDCCEDSECKWERWKT